MAARTPFPDEIGPGRHYHLQARRTVEMAKKEDKKEAKSSAGKEEPRAKGRTSKKEKQPTPPKQSSETPSTDHDDEEILEVEMEGEELVELDEGAKPAHDGTMLSTPKTQMSKSTPSTATSAASRKSTASAQRTEVPSPSRETPKRQRDRKRGPALMDSADAKRFLSEDSADRRKSTQPALPNPTEAITDLADSVSKLTEAVTNVCREVGAFKADLVLLQACQEDGAKNSKHARKLSEGIRAKLTELEGQRQDTQRVVMGLENAVMITANKTSDSMRELMELRVETKHLREDVRARLSTLQNATSEIAKGQREGTEEVKAIRAITEQRQARKERSNNGTARPKPRQTSCVVCGGTHANGKCLNGLPPLEKKKAAIEAGICLTCSQLAASHVECPKKEHLCTLCSKTPALVGGIDNCRHQEWWCIVARVGRKTTIQNRATDTARGRAMGEASPHTSTSQRTEEKYF